MDFWGFDRAKTSLRLRVMKRLLTVSEPQDADRLAHAVPTLVTGRSLTIAEAEVLLAFVGGLKREPNLQNTGVKPNLTAMFHASFDLRVEGDQDESRQLALGSHHEILAQQVGRDLAFYFAKLGDSQVISKHIALFEERWAAHDSLNYYEFMSLFGSLLGCLEGLAQAQESAAVDQSIFVRLTSLCNSDFLSALQNRLVEHSASPTLSGPAFLRGVAEVAALYAPVSGSQLQNVVSFSGAQLDYLQNSPQLLGAHQRELEAVAAGAGAAGAAGAGVGAHELDAEVQGAINAHFRVFDYALGHDVDGFYEKLFSHTSRALVSFEQTSEPLTLTLATVSAKLAGDSYERLVEIFNYFIEFLSGLDASSAYHCARKFAEGCKTNFRDEGSRIKLLYSLINKLNTEEYNNVEQEENEACALQWVASLLSSTVAIVSAFESSDFAGLAVTMLDQKRGYINEKVDAQIIETWGLLVPYLDAPKFQEVLELLVHIDTFGKPVLSEAAKNSRISIATRCQDCDAYLEHLLDLMVLNGDAAHSAQTRALFAPLAVLAKRSGPVRVPRLIEKFRNAFLNLAALGITPESIKGEDYRNLKIVARWAPPLVNDESANHVESEFQLNPILCRAISSNVLKIQQNQLSKVISMPKLSHHNSCERTIFLAATLLLEDLRCRAGSVSKLPLYFADTDLEQGPGHTAMVELTHYLTKLYVSKLGFFESAGASAAAGTAGTAGAGAGAGGLVAIAHNLKDLLVLACHRVESVRHIAAEIVSRIVAEIPAALCQHTALYTLLDCLTLLGNSTRNAIEDEFSPKPAFTAPVSGVTLELSDSYEVRAQNLREFETHARRWISRLSVILAPDLRSKLYTYLSNNKTRGRGRKLALEVLSTNEGEDDLFGQYLQLSLYDTEKSLKNPEAAVEKLRTAKTAHDLEEAYALAAPHVNTNSSHAVLIVSEAVRAPFRIFTDQAMLTGIVFWHHTIRHQDVLRPAVINEVVEQSILTVSASKGLFSREYDDVNPLWAEMEYAPSSKKKLNRHESLMKYHLAPHTRLLTGFLRSCMHNSVLLDQIYMVMFNRLTFAWLQGLVDRGSNHSLARNLRLEVMEFATEQLQFLKAFQTTAPSSRTQARYLESLIVKAGLSWYASGEPQWPFGSNLKDQAKTLNLLRFFVGYFRSSSPSESGASGLLRTLISQEHDKISAWHDPFGTAGTFGNNIITANQIQTAWQINPHLAVQIGKWWHADATSLVALNQLVEANLVAVHGCPEALYLYLDSRKSLDKISPRVILWHQVSPIESINLLSPTYGRSKAIIQFALRSLELHPILKCFFYVPQIVQQLRHDDSGMVAEYILETAKFSQKFAHQIIWNIMANMYMDDDGTVPDPMKPTLDKVLNDIIEQFSKEERDYYETEFSFFAEVTDVSGKLKPYIKKSKAEKKEKIDEEIAKIKVPEGAYLPSHPDGTVIDIDRNSGRPLQSHAKAPFLARFLIRVDVEDVKEDNVMEVERRTEEVWQGAIFKVGDDCRQDVLALQLISVFRSIFNFCGLDVYVFPNKVTATAAGRGVIDVLPNSISRDMLGREAVNGLDQWFHSKHGGPNSTEFQRARLNFVKSMAAYSVITYLLQFKDRHNGNIMYDDDGHVIHIDFGFCFDITPGGMGFEAAPFKLTKEMVRVMGGSQTALPFKWFEKLCVQVYLASRVYADDICRMVTPMLESGLPCFKGHTIKRMRERFALNKNEAEAAQYMRQLISKSYESNFTKGYDEFQRLTNGIPY